LGTDANALRRASRRTSRAEFILQASGDRQKIISQNSAMTPGLFQKEEWKSNMIKKLLGATAMVAIAYAVVPADAAKMGAGCSGGNLAKTETAIENMADGDGKLAAQKELSAAQDAMLGGKMGVCGAHLSKAMHATMAK
jgi:hypothetical protein